MRRRRKKKRRRMGTGSYSSRETECPTLSTEYQGQTGGNHGLTCTRCLALPCIHPLPNPLLLPLRAHYLSYPYINIPPLPILHSLTSPSHQSSFNPKNLPSTRIH